MMKKKKKKKLRLIIFQDVLDGREEEKPCGHQTYEHTSDLKQN